MTLAKQMLEDSRLMSEVKSAPPIKASDLIEKFQQVLAEKWGYIWGKSGQVWTQASQDAATRDMTVRYGKKWVGRKVADCSGLFVWAYKQLGASIYHGSNTIWKKYTTSRKGKVSDLTTIRPGTAVFQYRESDGNRHHIGLYIGGGMCIEAKGTAYGVVRSELAQWDEYGELSDVDYTGMPEEPVTQTRRMLRKGSTGADVEYLQLLLKAEGYDIGKSGPKGDGIDGKFGSETLSAVRAYQSDHDLNPDGIVGPMTWAELEYDGPNEGDQEGAVAAPDGSQEPADLWESLTLEEKVEDLNERLKRQEGGIPNA